MSGFKFWLTVGIVGVGAYILGARAGRSRYREISKAAKHLWGGIGQRPDGEPVLRRGDPGRTAEAG